MKDAGVHFDTGFAGNTAGQGLVADPKNVRADILRFQSVRHCGQGGVGAALFMRTAVDK